jgi:hypothetical protein
MMASKKSNYLSFLIYVATKENWCVDYACTTCGGQLYRRRLSKLSRPELVEQLMSLPDSFVNARPHRQALLFAMYASVESNFYILLNEFGDTPIARFLENAIRIEKERKENAKHRIEQEQLEKKLKDKARAQKNIWGAVKRKDIPAINSLMLKGVNLNQKGLNGLMLKDEIGKLGVIC